MLATLTIASLACGAGCGAGEEDDATTARVVIKADPTDVPLRDASEAERTLFLKGDALFDKVFQDPDGIGPLYVRRSCGECHEGALRGPGVVRTMWVVLPDGTPSADQSKLPFGHSERNFTAAGASVPVVPPDDPSVRVSKRLPPVVFGRGYMEAVRDDEIERVAAEQQARPDAIKGRIHRVAYGSAMSADPAFHTLVKGDKGLIGRFGLKARLATLDDFTADAYAGDMGITSPLRPTELPNPDGLTDDAKPGVDIPLEELRQVTAYMRLLELPARKATPGETLFDASRCGVCHTPKLRTKADFPIAALRDIDAWLYSDMLLHDMGKDASDGSREGDALPSEWRTAPLIGLRHQRAFLHDGRARTVEEAILAHDGEGSQAKGSVDLFRALQPADRRALVAFVASL